MSDTLPSLYSPEGTRALQAVLDESQPFEAAQDVEPGELDDPVNVGDAGSQARMAAICQSFSGEGSAQLTLEEAYAALARLAGR